MATAAYQLNPSDLNNDLYGQSAAPAPLPGVDLTMPTQSIAAHEAGEPPPLDPPPEEDDDDFVLSFDSPDQENKPQ
jgi:hypothetical protein